MSDPVVEVTVVEEPVQVTVSDNTPQVTVTDNNSSIVTVIDSSPKTVVNTAKEPHVTVLLGGGRGPIWLPGNTVNEQQLLDMLTGAISEVHLVSELSTDLSYTKDQLVRLSNQYDMAESDITTLYSSLTHTDTDITAAVTRIDGHDGDLAIAQGELVIQSNKITSTVNRMDLVEGNITYQGSQISQNATQISQHVTQFLSTTAEISRVDSLVTQNATSINAAVVRVGSLELAADATLTRQTLDDARMAVIEADVSTAYTNINQNTDSIIAEVVRINTLTNRMDSADIILTDHSATIQVMEGSLDGTTAELTSVQEMLSTQWGVTITEDFNGNAYATGFGLVLYPDWIRAYAYVVDDLIWFEGSVWKALVNHTSDTLNYPVLNGGYWVEVPGGTKTNFNVSADSFTVQTDTGSSINPFTVVGDQVQVNGTFVVGLEYATVNGIPTDLSDINAAQAATLAMTDTWKQAGTTLINGGNIYTGTVTAGALKASDIFTNNIQSQNYVAGVSGYKLDSVGDAAYFNNMNVDMTDGEIIVRNGITQDYAQLTDGELNFWYYNGAGYSSYNSIRRLEAGVANNGVITTLNGIWRKRPSIIVSPNTIKTYLASSNTADQSITMSAANIVETAAGSRVWKFTPLATLNTSAAVRNVAYANILCPPASLYQYATSAANGVTKTTLTNTVTIAVTCYLSGTIGGNNSGWASFGVYLYIDGIRYDITFVSTTFGYGNVSLNLSKTISVPANTHNYYLRVEQYNALMGWNLTLSNIQFTENLGATSVLATGSLNYVAIGE